MVWHGALRDGQDGAIAMLFFRCSGDRFQRRGSQAVEGSLFLVR